MKYEGQFIEKGFHKSYIYGFLCDCIANIELKLIRDCLKEVDENLEYVNPKKKHIHILIKLSFLFKK